MAAAESGAGWILKETMKILQKWTFSLLEAAFYLQLRSLSPILSRLTPCHFPSPVCSVHLLAIYLETGVARLRPGVISYRSEHYLVKVGQFGVKVFYQQSGLINDEIV